MLGLPCAKLSFVIVRDQGQIIISVQKDTDSTQRPRSLTYPHDCGYIHNNRSERNSLTLFRFNNSCESLILWHF